MSDSTQISSPGRASCETSAANALGNGNGEKLRGTLAQLSGVYSSGNPEAYPISSFTYIIVYKGAGPKSADVTALWSWAMSAKAQEDSKSLYYAPLPAALTLGGN